MGRVFTKPSFREQLRKAQVANDWYADMSGRPRMEAKVMPPVRKRKAVDQDNAEAGVIPEIKELLKYHPAVVIAIRYNSGAAQRENPTKHGEFIPLHFHTWIRAPYEMLIVDFEGFLRDGIPFAIEAKRRDWKKPSGERELKQQARIMFIRSIGGRAGFATCSEEAQAIIESRHALI
jgi:hypothetical protein